MKLRTEINYEIKGTGRPLIMLNGYYADMRSMQGCMEPIFRGRSGFCRIYIDHPGVGQSRGEEWIKTGDDMLQVLLSFIDTVIPQESFLLAARSMGAYFARGILNKRFDLVDGLLLFCPVIEPDLEKADVDREGEEVTIVNPSRKERIDQRLKDEVIASVQYADKEFLERVRGNGITFSFDPDKLKSPFSKPTLFLAGRQDRVAGYRDIFKILPSFPHASLHVIDNASHILQIEQEELFSFLVSKWLTKVQEQSRRSCDKGGSRVN